MSKPLLSVETLRVEYEDVTAVDDVSFEVAAGSVYGLIGPNGAGKTSVIRAVSTLLEPTYGNVRIADVDVADGDRAVLRRIGYMPDFPPLMPDLSVREFLTMFASAYGVPRSDRRGLVESLAAKVRLTEKLDAETGTLSRGMKQRLFLAKTLINDPEVLLLDEPASGLDPTARRELRDVIVELGRNGKAVVISSHILSEMVDFCDSVGIMEAGKLIVSGRIEEILERVRPGTALTIRLERPDVRLDGFLAARPGTSGITSRSDGTTLTLQGGEPAAAELLRALIAAEFPVVSFHAETGDLTDIFFQLSSGGVS